MELRSAHHAVRNGEKWNTINVICENWKRRKQKANNEETKEYDTQEYAKSSRKNANWS